MTNKEKIAELKATAQELQRQIDELENKPEINYWQPKDGDLYWYVMTCLTLGNSYNNYSKRHRVFKTKEEAEKYAEYVKAEETLREAIAIANEGELPDLSKNDRYNYFIGLNAHDKTLFVNFYTAVKYQPNFMYVKSKELAEKLMKEYEQEFRTYLSY